MSETAPRYAAVPPIRQPLPKPGQGDIASLVMADIRKRRELGLATYGTPLQAYNGRDALLDLYEELIDAAMYIRQAMEERISIGSDSATVGWITVWRDRRIEPRNLMEQLGESGRAILTDLVLRYPNPSSYRHLTTAMGHGGMGTSPEAHVVRVTMHRLRNSLQRYQPTGCQTLSIESLKGYGYILAIGDDV